MGIRGRKGTFKLNIFKCLVINTSDKECVPRARQTHGTCWRRGSLENLQFRKYTPHVCAIWYSLDYWCYASILKFVRPGRTFSCTSKSNSFSFFFFFPPGKKKKKRFVFIPSLRYCLHKNHAFNLASMRLAAIISWKSFVKRKKKKATAKRCRLQLNIWALTFIWNDNVNYVYFIVNREGYIFPLGLHLLACKSSAASSLL